jgi:hypothetical protein
MKIIEALATNRTPIEEGQTANRDWWTKLPMSYQDWDSKDRTPDAEKIVDFFLQGNPYLQPQHFAMAGKRVLEIGCGSGPAS